MYYLYGFIITTILFGIYSELLLGNISLRPNSSGVIEFNLMSMINYMLNPLWNDFLWNKELLFYNFIFVIVLYTIFYLIVYIYV